MPYVDSMAHRAEAEVIIIGAGVSGLTTAICLAEAGLAVRVLAKDPPARTTSALAGASWGPYLADDSRILDWSSRTLVALQSLAEADPTCGVRLMPGLEAAPYPLDAPGWARGVPGFRECRPAELPAGYVSGWRYTIPIADMPRYLAFLERRLRTAGITVEPGVVMTFHEAARLAPVVVNCTGLASRTLVPDETVTPTRGQLVVVRNPGIDWFFQDHAEDDELTYFLPHQDHVVCGGSAIAGSDNLQPDPAIAEAIISRCARVEPRLAKATVLGHRVGLRPSRARVRVEQEDRDGHAVIHNYGHGGSGLTLSWGCAQTVLAYVTSHLGVATANAPAPGR